MKKIDMEPGKKYHIKLDDCCIQGRITGIFEGWDCRDEEDENYWNAIFDIGTIGPL